MVGSILNYLPWSCVFRGDLEPGQGLYLSWCGLDLHPERWSLCRGFRPGVSVSEDWQERVARFSQGKFEVLRTAFSFQLLHQPSLQILVQSSDGMVCRDAFGRLCEPNKMQWFFEQLVAQNDEAPANAQDESRAAPWAIDPVFWGMDIMRFKYPNHLLYAS
ncbi:hypothetical protein IWQ52_004990 [Labrenzia sp. EL_159]|nr:hypothetical protein [Labrenzia sp. EL_162]MBG6197443.1 hypothetical protein [Labrenzia sp. EL_159]